MNIPFFSNEQFEVVLQEGNNAAGFRDFAPIITRGISGRISQFGESGVSVVPHKRADDKTARELESHIDGQALMVAIRDARDEQRTQEEKSWIEAQGYEYSEND